MLRKFLRFFGVGAFVCGLMMSFVGSKSDAAVMTPPFATDTFLSDFDVCLHLHPSYIMQQNEVLVRVKGSDFPGTSTTVRREVNATPGFFGTDTVNTEFQSMHLAGGVVTPGAFFGTPVQFKVGQGTGFRPGLGRSPGQVAENAGPLNGQLDVFLPIASLTCFSTFGLMLTPTGWLITERFFGITINLYVWQTPRSTDSLAGRRFL